MARIANTPYDFGYLDVTGDNFNLKKVTAWHDGSTMTDFKVDGIVYQKIGDEYFKRVGSHRINIETLGCKGDGVFRNELILAGAMRKLPPFTEYYIPEGTFLFGPLPAKYNNAFGTPVAIDLGTTGASFIGSGKTSIIQLTEGTVGFQATAGLVRGIIRFKDFDVHGPGPSATDGKVTQNGYYFLDDKGNSTTVENPDYQREIGSYSKSIHNYLFNGINAWCQVEIDSVNVISCSGHGVAVIGSPDIKVSGVPYAMHGTFESGLGESGRRYLKFFTEENTTQYGWPLEYNGINFFQTGTYPDGSLALDPSLNPPNGEGIITVTPKGGSMIADLGVIRNFNFDFNSGCGLIFQGADANQTNVFGGSVRENGFWGIYDNSFLGSFFYGTHGTRNGKNFNINGKLDVGAFTTVGLNARSGWYGCYTEEGNQGPSYFEVRTGVVDGIHAAGVKGPCFRREGTYISEVNAGDIRLKNGELIAKFGDQDRYPLRFTQYGPDKTYGFVVGDAAVGQGAIPRLLISSTGDALRAGNGTPLRAAPANGIQVHVFYIGSTKHAHGESLEVYLASVDPNSANLDLIGDVVKVRRTGGPMSYICSKSGTPEVKPTYVPDDKGVGLLSERPTKTLKAYDIGWFYYSTDTRNVSVWTGAETGWEDIGGGGAIINRVLQK